jgi:hypothetical protein
MILAPLVGAEWWNLSTAAIPIFVSDSADMPTHVTKCAGNRSLETRISFTGYVTVYRVEI